MTISYNNHEDSDQFNTGSFDIREHLDKLEPGKEKNKFVCPVCSGHNLGVDPKTGKYRCFTSECASTDIREAIRPLAEFLAERKGEQSAPRPKKPRAKKKEYSAVPIPIGAKLLRLPAPGQSPQPEPLARDTPKNVPSKALQQITYEYSDTQRVVRYEWLDETNPKGRDKTYRQFHIDPDGKKVWTKGDARWSAYRIDEVVELLKTIPDGEPIIILMPEGEPNVELARSISLAGLTLQGSSWSDSETQKMLEALQATGKNVSLAIIRDNDDTGIKKGKGVGLVARHIKFPCIVIDPCVIYPDIPEKGDIREILEAIGSDEFLKRLELEIASQAVAMAAIEEKSVSIQQSKPSSVESPIASNSLPAVCKNEVLINKISAEWGNRLRFNEMTQQVEMDGDAANIDVEKAYLRAAKELQLDIDKQKASDIVAVCAQENKYSPVREYLNSVAGGEKINLESLAERYFGTQDPFHAILLKRTLIAAVARAFKPGCKVDTMCILQGGQGALKSTFWQTLAGEAWFTDNLSEASEKDEKLKLRRYWILEFSEFETVYKRKDVEQLKAFLSSRIDSLRRPYGRSLEDFPRTSIFVGSTNRQEFLNDPTGGRRYWVIPVVAETIPIQTLEEERDRIWAAAVAAYRSGEQWWLTREEDELLTEANKGWQSSDTWEMAVLNDLENKSICTVSELLTRVLQIELAKQGKAEQMRLSDILRRNGWVRSKKRIEGKPQWCWEKVVSKVGTPLNPCSTPILDAAFPPNTEVVSEVGTPLNPCPVTISNTTFPPVPTFLPKDSSNNNDSTGTNIVIRNETPEVEVPAKVENQGGNAYFDNSENLSGQSIERVPTSHNQGGNTSAKVEKVTDENAQAILENCGNVKENSDAGDAFHSEASKALSREGFEAASPPASPPALPPQVTSKEFAEQIRKAIANLDQPLALEIEEALKGKAKAKLRDEVKNALAPIERKNFKLLAKAGFLLDMRVKYVGDSKYAEQYEGLELEVYGMDEYGQITCRKPDGYLTTRMKPEELEKL